MSEALNNAADAGVDAVASFVINKFLPVNSDIKKALTQGVDIATDKIFCPVAGNHVAVQDHSEFKQLVDAFLPMVIGLVDNKVLHVVDLPFLEGENEDAVKEAFLQQTEAVLRQATTNLLLTKK